MTELENAIVEHISRIVLSEHRPASYLDLLYFSARGKVYRPSYGTIRNKLSILKKAGKITKVYNSGIAFFTRPGYPFSKESVTTDHIGVVHNRRRSDFLYDILSRMPEKSHSLHDIRLRFTLTGAWSILAASGKYPQTPVSRDIRLSGWTFGECRQYEVVVCHNDTVSVIVSCSCHPLAVDLAGLRQITEDLTRVEERLHRLLDQEVMNRQGTQENTADIKIPPHTNWIVTMWHFGVDGEYSFDKEAFHMTYSAGAEGLERLYTKDIADHSDGSRVKRVVRHEVQECPNKPLASAFNDKLDTIFGIKVENATQT